MKINNKFLHIPPYISTTWNQIKTICIKDNHLIIILSNETSIEIPNLTTENLETIFAAHSTYLENTQIIPNDHTARISRIKTTPIINSTSLFDDHTVSFGLGTLDTLGSTMSHNESQSNMPDLPKEILSKISAIAKIIAQDESIPLPKPEPHCNCAHCQIARALHEGLNEPNAKEQIVQIEEEVKDIDLNFQQWDIQQTGEKLFSVSHRLDSKDKYSVYLGYPVGCTCGKEGCEHLLAVLKS